MGKGPLFLNVMRGKVGNVVGYALKNSNNKEKQAFRAYVAQVSNPRTELQAIQRLKMSPAVNFYRQLSRILDNAWQGQRYGNLSRQYFMSQALSQTTGIPFIVKDDKRFYPGEYPVAQGSLVRINIASIAADTLTTSLVSPGISGTWGEFSQGLVNRNFGVVDGDKLTFIFVGTNALGEYLPAYSYVILDTTSETPAAEIVASSNMTFTGAAGEALGVSVINAVSGIVAGAVILSRLDQSGSSPKWLRSNSAMFCSEAYKEVMMSAAAYQAAVASYMDSNAFSSDWYLNEGLTGSVVNYGPGGNSGSNLTVVSVDNITFAEDQVSRVVAIATLSDGSKRAYKNNATNAVMLVLSGGVLSPSTVAATAVRLALIQEADPLVTGWIVVNTSSSDTVIEEP